MRAVALVLLSACSFVHGTASRQDAGDDASGSGSDGGSGSGSDGSTATALRAKTITIGTVTGMHTNFPLWVMLDDPDLRNRARADGTDIFFTTTAGAMLDYEIQKWTKTSGHLEAWVRVPSLATNATVQVRYGDVSVARPPNAPGVFAAYGAVWHLEDALNNATIAEAKGTVPGTAMNLQTNDQVSAKLGGGINFSNGTDQITFTNPLTGAGAHTISLWVNQRTTGDNDAMVVLGNGATNEARWFHSRYNAATIAVGFYANDYTNANADIQGDGWVLLHWVFEGANRMSRLYRGGVLVAGPFQHAMGIDTTGTAGILGNAPAAFGTNMGLTGALDEVRIIGTARNPEWIAAEAANQTTPATFYTVGAELTP